MSDVVAQAEDQNTADTATYGNGLIGPPEFVLPTPSEPEKPSASAASPGALDEVEFVGDISQLGVKEEFQPLSGAELAALENTPSVEEPAETEQAERFRRILGLQQDRSWSLLDDRFGSLADDGARQAYDRFADLIEEGSERDRFLILPSSGDRESSTVRSPFISHSTQREIWSSVDRLLGDLETDLHFGKGLVQGVLQDGLIGTVQGFWGLVQGAWGASKWAYQATTDYLAYDMLRTIGMHDAAEQTGHWDRRQKIVKAAAKYGPTLKALVNDLDSLTGLSDEPLSQETLRVLMASAIAIEGIEQTLRDEWKSLDENERSELMGRVTGVVLFEVVTLGSANAAKAGKFGKLDGLLDGLPLSPAAREKITGYVRDAVARFKGSKTLSRSARVLTGIRYWDEPLEAVAELAAFEKRMSAAGFTVSRSASPGGGSAVDGITRVVYLDPNSATRLTLYHELRHVKQYARLADAGLDAQRLRTIARENRFAYDGIIAYLEEGALYYEKSLFGGNSEWARRLAEQGWAKRFRQKYRFNPSFQETIDLIPWKLGEF